MQILNRILHILARHLPGYRLRVFLHRLRGVRIGNNCYIGEELFIDGAYPHLVSIGNGTHVNYGTIILAHSGFEKPEPVSIGSNVIIGVGSIILPGVKIGNNAKVGAGAVVTKDVPKNAFVVGVPAKIKK